MSLLLHPFCPAKRTITTLTVAAFRSYYPEISISDEISTEKERVDFLQAVAQVMLTKARTKLNIRKLYAADGLAVKELLKIASLLYKATQKATVDDEVRTAWQCIISFSLN